MWKSILENILFVTGIEKDWTPERFSHAAYTLEYEGKQVGAIEARGINDVIGMLTKPNSKGDGTQFLKMMIGEAKRQGKKSFIVRDVIGKKNHCARARCMHDVFLVTK